VPMTRAARKPEILQGKVVVLTSSFGSVVSPVAGMVQAPTSVSLLLVIASYKVAGDLGGSEWIMYASKGILVGTSAELAASLVMPDMQTVFKGSVEKLSGVGHLGGHLELSDNTVVKIISNAEAY
jgi:hypothetical protein